MLAANIITFVLTSLLNVPLGTMMLRLGLQRVHDEKDFVEGQPMTEAEQGTRLEVQEYCLETNVLGQRDELDPYKSLYDCFLRMKQEEGWKVFYRGYWLAALQMFFTRKISSWTLSV
ncbi:hypothetical protein VKT23_007509 [Stygiomarasmius scandens]|uniref:Uncharacterized protein n=1 Tax=Marasmiellus scandens TaxID=2682957 RepID=A0ABR1JRA3_9AGAR